MNVLVVVAHPLAGSLTHALADRVTATLAAQGHAPTRLDLYAQAFNPVLSAEERSRHYDLQRPPEPTPESAALLVADALVLCFPTWWFGPPAILKGWFDRVWAPGVAYDHAPDLGAIRPRLQRLQRTLVITTLGSPGWVDRIVMRQPVRRVIKTALLATCAPQCRFDMLSLHRAEKLTPAQVARFGRRIDAALARWGDGSVRRSGAESDSA